MSIITDALVWTEYVESLVASLCFTYSSVRKRVIRLHDATQFEQMHVAVRGIDEEGVGGELPKAKRNIFLEEKSGWFDLPEDRLERFERFDKEGYNEKIDEW